MHPAKYRRPALTPLALLALLFLLPSARAQSEHPTEKARLRAIDLEKAGRWAEACRVWADLGRKDRSSTFFREGYHRCLRRLHVSVRQADGVYRAAVARLSAPQALELYEQVLSVLSVAHPDKDRANFQSLFQHGLSELRDALDEPAFRKNHFPDVKEAALSAFKARLASWTLVRIKTKAEACEQALAVARAAGREGVPLRQGVMAALILEFAAGACNALDEHSLFVTPGQLGVVQAALRGKLAGVGLELTIRDDRLQVGAVQTGTSAASESVRPGDLVIKIAGASVEALPAEAAAERLRGEPGSSVEVELARPAKDALETITVRLVRRAVPLPSVEPVEILDVDGERAGLLRINYFAKTTAADVKSALERAAMAGGPLKGVILDLRGNPGGLFDSAVAVAELFLPEGVVVIGSSPFKEYNKPFKVEVPGPFQMPVVVWVDGDTASAAEVLAGAIKENRGPRGSALVGSVGKEPTYGKGSIQCMIPLDKSALDRPAALKLTVARLFSPANQPYTGKGVMPDHRADSLEDARILLKQLLGSPLMPSGDLAMGMPMP